ncbi:hypothetical protein DVH24_028522 [Malus domestica]|uniref:Uncharacterized protein n=1 Tax=Malus domestica TaxID=3750 RepID=A0A498IZ62_MALDO|nr:hypothetical protein DVH24_028522 [Malus domestica]
MVWVEDHIGWNWSFLITVTALSFSLVIFVTGTPFYRHKRPTAGNSLTRIITVLACAARNWKASSNERMGNQYAVSPINRNRADGQSYDKLKFLDKALIGNTISAAHVEETRTFLGLLPIFASTIMMNCCLAQVETFSVVQGSKMNRKLHNFEIPTQSLNVPPLSIMLASIPLCGRFQHKSHMLQPLWRIGLGIALASGSMAVAALVEAKRREAAHNDVTLSVFWLGWQFLLLGVCDVLTLGGMLEFFYSEAPSTMRSMCAALSWCSISLGYFLSSVLVSIANSVSGKFGTQWLGGDDLNHMRLDLFYTLLGILNTGNFLNYMYWAKRDKLQWVDLSEVKKDGGHPSLVQNPTRVLRKDLLTFEPYWRWLLEQFHRGTDRSAPKLSSPAQARQETGSKSIDPHAEPSDVSRAINRDNLRF